MDPPVELAPFENNYFTEMCGGSEAGSYLRLIDFVYHSTLGSRVIKKKKEQEGRASSVESILRMSAVQGVVCRA